MVHLAHYIATADAITELFQPLAEVVIHDIAASKIIYIKGSLSKRAVGDPSLLDETLDEIGLNAYSKINFDGRLIKSISIPIRDSGTIKYLMCINYDISHFMKMHTLLEEVVSTPISRRPEQLFKKDWQNHINEFIANELDTMGLRFEQLSNKDKKQIVNRLFLSGAFSEKNAADYIAKIMNMSRATIFNYLRIFKKDSHEM